MRYDDAMVENIDYVFELLPQILSRRSGKAARVACHTEIMSTDATDDTTKAPEKVRMCFSGYPIMSTLVEKVEIMMKQMFASECFNVPFPTKFIHIATIPKPL